MDKDHTTMSLFHSIIPFVLKWEGGYVNDPHDPGGETKYGISKRAHPELDIKNLTPQQALQVYYTDYWEDQWDKLGFALAACMLDTAVNMGKSRAKDFLKRCEGSHVIYLQLRIAKYKDIVDKKPTMKRFFNGWMNRVTDLRRFIDGEMQDSIRRVNVERPSTLPHDGSSVG